MAQSVEHIVHIDGVVGSSPTVTTEKYPPFTGGYFFVIAAWLLINDRRRCEHIDGANERSGSPVGCPAKQEATRVCWRERETGVRSKGSGRPLSERTLVRVQLSPQKSLSLKSLMQSFCLRVGNFYMFMPDFVPYK